MLVRMWVSKGSIRMRNTARIPLQTDPRKHAKDLHDARSLRVANTSPERVEIAGSDRNIKKHRQKDGRPHCQAVACVFLAAEHMCERLTISGRDDPSSRGKLPGLIRGSDPALCHADLKPAFARSSEAGNSGSINTAN